MSHGFQEVTLQTTGHEVISHDQAVASMVLMVQNGKKYIIYLYHILKHLLTF